MKRWVCILIILFNFGVCRAQWEHLFLSRFNPKIIYTRDREEDKPAGYELSIPWMYNGVYAINDNKSFWTFLTSKRHGTIGIQTPMLTYNGTTTILRIIDTTKTVYNIVSFDTIRNRIPETIISNLFFKEAKEPKEYDYSKRQFNNLSDKYQTAKFRKNLSGGDNTNS